MKRPHFLAQVAVIALLSGCSKDLDFIKALENKKAEEILAAGEAEMRAKHYGDAIKIFEELSRLHPYSRLNAEAELHAGDCQYKLKKYENATAYYETFVKTRPTNAKVPYALYMLGLVNFAQMAIIERDQETAVNAVSYFTMLCERYPKSEYVADAKKKIDLLNGQLAGQEVYIARQYQKLHNYAAAIERLNAVIDLYYKTAHAPEALHRCAECYIATGLLDEARQVNKVLQRDFPKTAWAEHSRKLMAKNAR
jgi:outer membrane protein assembly factor BamD